MGDRLDRIEQMLADLIRIVGNTNSMVQELCSDVQKLQTDVQKLQTDVKKLQTDVQGLQTDVAELKSESKKTNERINQLEQTINERFDRQEVAFDIVRQRQSDLEVEVHYMKKVISR